VKDAKGEIVELRCTWDPDSRGGNAADGRKIKGTIHWVSSAHALGADVRLYDRLFRVENPLVDKDTWTTHLNPTSLETVETARVEPSLANSNPGDRFQFERIGYFCVDKESTATRQVFNRTISLKDSWAAQTRKS
jgi:glutaminyl-tRNA synthetase